MGGLLEVPQNATLQFWTEHSLPGFPLTVPFSLFFSCSFFPFLLLVAPLLWCGLVHGDRQCVCAVQELIRSGADDVKSKALQAAGNLAFCRENRTLLLQAEGFKEVMVRMADQGAVVKHEVRMSAIRALAILGELPFSQTRTRDVQNGRFRHCHERAHERYQSPRYPR